MCDGWCGDGGGFWLRLPIEPFTDHRAVPLHPALVGADALGRLIGVRPLAQNVLQGGEWLLEGLGQERARMPVGYTDQVASVASQSVTKCALERTHTAHPAMNHIGWTNRFRHPGQKIPYTTHQVRAKRRVQLVDRPLAGQPPRDSPQQPAQRPACLNVTPHRLPNVAVAGL